mmetsp:Transcript_22046/g.53981  ORF Transcript_22046/g.53981 Transcript_22046/m.53981 type:complete len:211 (+) Transcript_22046:691-1323(+)
MGRVVFVNHWFVQGCVRNFKAPIGFWGSCHCRKDNSSICKDTSNPRRTRLDDLRCSPLGCISCYRSSKCLLATGEPRGSVRFSAWAHRSGIFSGVLRASGNQAVLPPRHVLHGTDLGWREPACIGQQHLVQRRADEGVQHQRKKRKWRTQDGRNLRVIEDSWVRDWGRWVCVEAPRRIPSDCWNTSVSISSLDPKPDHRPFWGHFCSGRP